MGRLYKINENYFEIIDTEVKAYLLGFIFADGCLRQGKGNRQDRLSLGIHHADRNIIDKFSSEISPENTTSIVHAPAMIRNGHAAQARWSVSSDKMSSDLKRLGIKHRKSKVGMDFPILKPSMIRHFIRGFFDGDGGITVAEVKNRYKRVTTYVIPNSFKKKLRKRVYFCSTDKAFLDRIFEELPEIPGKVQKRCQRNCWVYTIEHQKAIPIIQEYLYEGASIYLDRKFSKFNMTIKSQAADAEGLETT